jgi:predicted dehydrogenase
MKKVRVGFIGAGQISELHARAYVENPTGELVAIADSAPGLAERRVAEWGAQRAYNDYHELLADPDIDAVEILLPHHLHREAAVAALDSGKHVSLQKPMALNLHEADQIAAAAERAGTVFRVFDNFLAYVPYRFATSLIEAGEIGEPRFIRFMVVRGKQVGGWQESESAKEWRRDPKLSGGNFFFDHGAHVAATIVHFMGRVEAVHAITGRNVGAEISDTGGAAAITFRHVDGRGLGTWTGITSPDLTVSTDYYSADERAEITGDRGIIWINQSSARLLGGPPVSLYRDGEVRHFTDMETDWGESFRTGGMEFTAAIANGGHLGVTADDARHVLAFLLAAKTSAIEHREVAIADMG